MPANCLEHVKDIWPRDGILRVEIIQPHTPDFTEQSGMLGDLFTIEKSYKREFELKRQKKNDENISQFLKFFTEMYSSK